MSTALHEPSMVDLRSKESYRTEKRTLTMEEACHRIGMPRSTGYDLANAGAFPCRILRIGGRWYIPVDAVEELLSGQSA